MRYHKQVYWPAALNRLMPQGVRSIAYTYHAKDASRRYSSFAIPLPTASDFSSMVIFEAEIDVTGRLCKVVGTLPLDTERVACYVVGIERDKSLFVKTVWANNIVDNHATLDITPYAKAG